VRALSVIAALVLASPPASAEDSAEQLAREQFQRGKRLFVLQEYRKALDAFRKARQLQALPEMLFMIGQCHRNLGSHVEAIRAYQGYLAGKPDAEDRRQVEALIAELERRTPTSGPGPPPPESMPTPKGQPIGRATRPAQRGAHPAMTMPPPAPVVRRRPLYRRWWFWAVVGGVAVAALGTGLAVGYSRRPHSPAGSIGTVDLR